MPADLVARLRAAGCVFAEEEGALLLAAAGTPAELDRLVDQRVGGMPLEYVLGWVDFCGVRVGVGPGVFVPRRRTEFLVQQAVRRAHPGALVVDLCCGSGAIGAAVAAALGPCKLYAVDVDPVAVDWARRNLEDRGEVLEGDLYDPLPPRLRGRIDLLLGNAPYVPTAAIPLMPPEARDHEPRVALDGGPDGLEVHRRLLASAGDWLAPAGSVLVETSVAQAPTTVGLCAEAGLVARVVRCAERDATVVIAEHPAGSHDVGIPPRR